MQTTSCNKNRRTNPTLRFIKPAIKPILLSLLLNVTGHLSSTAQPNTWVQKSDVGYDAINVPEPTARQGAVGFSIGSKGYIGTGYDGYLLKDFWEYDPVANTWTQKADFGGTARIAAIGFNISSKGYIGTGSNFNEGWKDFWEYDPVSNTWTQKADFGGPRRSWAVGFSMGGKGYIGTGHSLSPDYTYLKDFWEYDPAVDKWTQKKDFGGVERYRAVGFSIGNKGYIGTGRDFNNSHQKDLWEYDPVIDKWTQKSDLGGAVRELAVGFSIGSKGYIGTGSYFDSNGDYYLLNDYWEFNPASNTWMQKTDFGESAREGAVGFAIGSKGYIGLGYSDEENRYSKNFLEYDPGTNVWTRKADFGRTVRSDAVGFSIDSKGYIGTGRDDIGIMKDFWEYDSGANTWTQKADFGGTPRSNAVGFSIRSKGYIGTGSDTYNITTNDFWEYDPVSNTWTRKADFAGAERSWAVGFSINDKGYLGTGSDVNNIFRKDFWQYDPVSNTWTQKVDFSGDGRYNAVGFSIASKGYIGTGQDLTGTSRKDFWQYDPAADAWIQKADFGGTARHLAVGFGIGTKGYIGTGYSGYPDYTYYKDFWEYDPIANTWMRKADFGGGARNGATGFSIGSKGYIGTGLDNNYLNCKDFWEYTPDNSNCPSPANLSLSKISDTCARLNWNIPDSSIEHIKVSYRKVGDTAWIADRKKSLEDHKIICGLTPNATYEWKVRNICADDKTGWVHGPNFTTSSSAFFSSLGIDSKLPNISSIQIIPNPNKGNFTLQMYLPAKALVTTLSLYNNLGEKMWQQHAGMLSGAVNKNIALENKLPAGIYVLIIQNGDTRLMQKVVVIK